MNIKGVRSFLGFANFYRNFIDHFVRIAAPLHNLTRSNTAFVWTPDHKKAFCTPKSLFINAPILAMWNEDKTTVLETDASGWATGGCLSQYDNDGNLRPVAYHSKMLAPVECNCDVHDKELLTIIRCLNEWRGELIGLQKPFTILTDHKNLKYFMTSRKLTERQFRWAQILSQFDFRLKFRAEVKAKRPVALSRRTQEIPKHHDDPRYQQREFRLLKKEWLETDIPCDKISLLPIKISNDQVVSEGNSLFETKELQDLWNRDKTEDATVFNVLYKKL